MSRKKLLGITLGLMILVIGVKTLWLDEVPFWKLLFPEDPRRQVFAVPAEPVAARPPTRPNTQWPTLIRELPRQAAFITAAHSFRLPACDRSVDFGGSVSAMPVVCGVSYDSGKRRVQIAISDVAGNSLKQIDLSLPMLKQQSPDYAKWAAAIESLSDSEFLPLLASTGIPRVPVAESDQPVSPEVEAMLSRIDSQSAFLAAQSLHQAIDKFGESPQQLAGLVRAYSHLGEATRGLYSAHGSAFFARSLIYAERLVRKHPSLAISHAARGYAYALLGMPVAGSHNFAKAHELQKAEADSPPWAALAEHLCAFHTRELFDRADDAPVAALASYFALLTVEHSGMQSLVINMSRLALKHNPGALRILQIMTDNGGVAIQHETTPLITQSQFALLAALASDDGVPLSVQSAARLAVNRKFDAQSLRELLGKMDQEPAAPGQLLPWSAYASISRDFLFVSGFRRLYFTDRILATDPSDRLKAWQEILKGHRFAPALVAFDRKADVSDRQAGADLRNIDEGDLRRRAPWLAERVRRITPNADERLWTSHYEYSSDETVYEVAHLLWAYGGEGSDAIKILGLLKGESAKSLLEMCPNHPSGLADFIVNRWPEARDKATEIEQQMGAHPQVAFALARAYRSEGRFDDSVRLLEQVIAISPDRWVYEELADVYKMQGNADKWLEVRQKYLTNSEDFGLDHARTNEQIAYTLMRMKQYDKALPYAKAAAESYSGWGLIVLASCQTERGQYAEAEQILRDCQSRYPNTFAWYRWCVITGKGDLNAARTLSESQAPQQEAHPRREYLNDVAVYLQIEGQLERARALWRKIFSGTADPYAALQLAMLDLEQGKTEDAQEVLERAKPEGIELPAEFAKQLGNVIPPADEERSKIYRLAVDEIARCLENGNSVPPRDGNVKMILDAREASARGNATYFFGRLCELRGRKEDAIWWYQNSMETANWNFSARAQSAAALRRFGIETYK